MKKYRCCILRLMALLMVLTMVLPLLPSAQAASLYTVKSTSTTTLAPGITQKIHTASYGDGTANVKYYVATADIRRSDVMVLNGYKDNNPKYGACNSVTVDKQVIASETAHQNPNNPNYIENYHVVAACNGGFFNIPSISGIENYMGAHIMEGVQYWDYDGRPFMAILKDGTAVVGAGTSDWNKYREHMQEAISGNVLLVKAGKNNTGNVDEDKAFVGQESGKLGTGRHPRTCCGVTKDGQVVMMVIDAQTTGSASVRGGATLNEAAQMLIDAGCYYAINMDGGGSSTYMTKEEGQTTPTLVNKPSGGSMRAICGSLLFASTAPQEALSFEFDGTGAQDYMRKQYARRNYDLANYWATGLAGSLTLKNYGVVMDNTAGTMTINLNDRGDGSHSTYFAPGAKDGTFNDAEATTSTAFTYNPAQAEVFRVRLKFTDATRFSTSKTPFWGVSYLSADTRTWTGFDLKANIPVEYLDGGAKEGQYVTLEIDLTNHAIRNCSALVSMRFQIGYLLKGSATIDYMYIGPKSADRLSFGFSEYGTHLNAFNDPAYGYLNFDKEGHWFKGNEVSSYDINHGALTMTVDNAPENLHNAYVETSMLSSKSVHPLHYTPKAGDVLVVRYRVVSYDAATNASLYGDAQKPTMTIYGYNDRQNVYKNPSALTIDPTQKGYVAKEWTVPTDWTGYDMSKLRLTMRYFVNSTIQIDYIYVGPRAGAPNNSQLYIGFDNTEADRNRYQSVTYGGMNMDTAGSWAVGNEYNLPVVSGGAIKMTPTATNTGYGYIHSGGAIGAYPLYYKPNAEDYIQVRFKIDNGVSSDKYASQTGIGRFAFFYGNQSVGARNYYVYHDFKVADVSNKGWVVFTYKLKDMKTSGTNMTALSEVTSISPCFNWVVSAAGKTVNFYIDYIYIGPQGTLPTPRYTVTFKGGAGETLETKVVHKGETASYTGPSPTKAADATNHYTFKGWDKACTNITANTTITAQFTATAHSYSYTKVDGTNHKATCSCGYSKTVAHTWDSGKITTAATCTAAGVKTYTCTACKATKTESIAKLAHSYTYKATKNPTTSATGTLTGTCSKCSGTTTVSLPKLNTTDYTKTVTKAATCTATGTDSYKWKTTTYGSFTFTATTAALGHNYTAKVTAPTCTAQGYTTHTCSRCSDSYKDTYTNATGHSYTYKATKNPTTSATGTLTGTCSKCSGTTTVSLPKLNTTDYTKTVTKAATCTATGTDSYKWKTTTYGSFTFTATTAALGHSYTAKVTAPTCTAQGYTTHTCSRCSDSYKDTYTNATGHSYSSKVTTAATCTKAGVKTFTCSKCSHSYTEAIAATGHTPVTDKAVSATCTTAGKTEGSHCSVCNAIIKAQTTVPAMGHSYTSKVTTAATCTKAGVKTFTCSKCNHSYTEAIAATGHTPVTDKAVAATCTTDGKTEGSHCSVCNAVIKAQTTVPATGHSYTSKVTTAATCTKEGVKTYTCSKCNHSYTEAIAATGHTPVTDKAIAATCTTAGKTEGSHCSVCNAVIKAQTTIPATGHSYSSKVTTAATCTKAGVKTFTCSKCNHSYTEAIAATGHTPVTDKAVAATCTTAGKTEGSHCSVCNAVIKAQTTIPATGHSYTSKVTTAATCTKAGVKTFTCSKCNHSYTEAIAATGHTPVTDKAVDATCTTAGKTEGSHCSVCNAVIKAQETVPATGHSYTSKVTTAATCTKAGVKTFTCSKCNHSYTEAIAATGHTPVTDKAVAATCTTAGKTEGSHCSVCNAVIKAQETVPATGHDYKYTDNGDGTHTGTCARCEDLFTENHKFDGETCFCGAKVLTLDESIKIYHTLDLASDISITFAVQQSALASYDSYYLEVVLPEYEGNVLTGTSTVEIQPVVNGKYYYFTLTGITAVRMGDMVDATLHMVRGTAQYISVVDTYSVATYAYGMLNSTTDSKMLTLCADLLRYGAEAQSFKGYRTDSLVDANLTEAQRSYLSNTENLTFSATDSFLNDLANPVLSWVGKTLDLGSKVGMKFVFNAKNYGGDIANLTMKVSYQGSNGEPKTVTLTGAEVYNANNCYYSFTFYGLLASELRTILDVAVFEGNTQLTETLRYSAESYASKNTTGALGNLCKALFAYSDSAKAYFTK